ncbi:hypothetical protein CC2G_013878 [Coprinopsis cinerea AmutBmut pab1-1]|nr:hypothetical protein CC2G_013878 [Coprinopsis cinerea AmutBmut pab1-1]
MPVRCQPLILSSIPVTQPQTEVASFQIDHRDLDNRVKVKTSGGWVGDWKLSRKGGYLCLSEDDQQYELVKHLDQLQRENPFRRALPRGEESMIIILDNSDPAIPPSHPAISVSEPANPLPLLSLLFLSTSHHCRCRICQL